MTDAPPGTVSPSLAPSLVVAARTPSTLLLCLSHLRWDFVFQRPQHLLTRAARTHAVIFLEEPLFRPGIAPRLDTHETPEGVTVAVPLLPEGLSPDAVVAAQRELLDGLLAGQAGRPMVAWFYTPMALEFAGHLHPDLTVYDCMDELSAFRCAPPRAGRRWSASCWRAPTWSSPAAAASTRPSATGTRTSTASPPAIDRAHFAARPRRAGGPRRPGRASRTPASASSAWSTSGWTSNWSAALAEARPDWTFVMIGPVVKIDPADLPRLPNIHWLGGKALCGTAGLSRGLGCRLHALRA